MELILEFRDQQHEFLHVPAVLGLVAVPDSRISPPAPAPKWISKLWEFALACLRHLNTCWQEPATSSPVRPVEQGARSGSGCPGESRSISTLSTPTTVLIVIACFGSRSRSASQIRPHGSEGQLRPTPAKTRTLKLRLNCVGQVLDLDSLSLYVLLWASCIVRRMWR